MTLATRIKRIEREICRDGPCPACGRKGKAGVVLVEGDDELDMTDKACPVCGIIRGVTIIRLMGVSDTEGRATGAES